jgi:hypothetical protein
VCDWIHSLWNWLGVVFCLPCWLVRQHHINMLSVSSWLLLQHNWSCWLSTVSRWLICLCVRVSGLHSLCCWIDCVIECIQLVCCVPSWFCCAIRHSLHSLSDWLLLCVQQFNIVYCVPSWINRKHDRWHSLRSLFDWILLQRNSSECVHGLQPWLIF